MRKVTFQSIGEIQGSQVWRNRETGVEIVKENYFYSVYAPDLNEPRTHLAYESTSLTKARIEAVRVAEAYRTTIARAYKAAHAEDKARRKAALAAATGEPSLSARPAPAEDETPPTPARIIYMVTFDRIGRRESPAPLMVSIPREEVSKAADLITVEVVKYARKFLNSPWFEVDVYLEDGLVEIGVGRFGRGKVTTRQEGEIS